jgi:hypothetical protein
LLRKSLPSSARHIGALAFGCIVIISIHVVSRPTFHTLFPPCDAAPINMVASVATPNEVGLIHTSFCTVRDGLVLACITCSAVLHLGLRASSDVFTCLARWLFFAARVGYRDVHCKVQRGNETARVMNNTSHITHISIVFV